MGRPNKTEEKRTQILDAFERIILTEGYAKASQRKIAQEANVNQPMIHHYFSGSEELLDALLNRVAERYQTALTLAFSDQESVTLEQFMAFVCSEKFHKISQQNEVFFALIGQGGHKDSVFKKMTDVYQEFLLTITQLLLDSNIANPEKVAYMSMCFIIGHDWAKKLGFGEERNQQMADFLSQQQ
mgnify:CR=1 FL=1